MNKPNKVETAILPTPLHRLNNISEDLGVNLYIKRDDLTGYGIGGNKLRKLDYLVKKALDEGYTTLLTFGGPQTNHGRLTATAAAKYGMKCIIMVYGKKEDYMTGNLVLDRILGAEVVFMDTTDLREKAKGKPYKEVAALYREIKFRSTRTIIRKYEEQGEKVFSIQIGGHSMEGLMGYFDCVNEFETQAKDMNIDFEYVITGNGSGGTLGGLALGKKYYKKDWKLIGINVSDKNEEGYNMLIDFLNKTSEEYDMGIEITSDDFTENNDYTGIDYNVPDKETRDAIYYMAQKEGILLDPCYTGKSFLGVLGLIKSGKISKNANVLYIHTGGAPGIWSDNHLEAFNNDLWTDITEFKTK